MKFTKKLSLTLVTIVTCFSATLGLSNLTLTAADGDDATTPATTAAAAAVPVPSLNVKAAIAVDADTGKIFYEQNSGEALGIASMTKLVSVYLVLEAVKAGKMAWTDTVPVSDYFINLSQNFALSNVALYAGVNYTVQDLYQASLIASANAAIMVLAEKVAGSQEAFVKMMNDKVKEFGITDATLVNASGLNNADVGAQVVPGTAADAENAMSARDMAIVARHLITDFPEVLKTTGQSKAVFAANTVSSIEMENWNWMLPGLANAYEGVDGLKTGTTDFAGACFTATATKNGNRVITVVLNALDHPNNNSARFIETKKLLDYVFADWSKQSFDATTVALPKTALPVTKGAEKTVSIGVKKTDPLTVWVQNGDKIATKATISKEVLNSKGELAAPITKGTQVGELTLTTADKLGYLEKADGTPETIAIETSSTVDKQNFFKGILDAIVDFFKGIGTWVANLFGGK